MHWSCLVRAFMHACNTRYYDHTNRATAHNAIMRSRTDRSIRRISSIINTELIFAHILTLQRNHLVTVDHQIDCDLRGVAHHRIATFDSVQRLLFNTIGIYRPAGIILSQTIPEDDLMILSESSYLSTNRVASNDGFTLLSLLYTVTY